MQQLQKTFEDHEIRIVHNDEPLFVAKDLCNALEISNTSMAMQRLDADEKGLCTIETNGGPQQMVVLNRKGVQRLLSTSRKPQAALLAKWFDFNVMETHVPCVEAKVVQLLHRVFGNHRISTETYIGSYRADLFFLDFDLVVEIDEDGHRYRNQIYEAQRDAFMEGSGYTVVRYDPDSEPIEVLYASIHEHIFNYQ